MARMHSQRNLVTEAKNFEVSPPNFLKIMSADLVKHTGGCHCGRVRFEILAKPVLKAYDCK